MFVFVFRFYCRWLNCFLLLFFYFRNLILSSLNLDFYSFIFISVSAFAFNRFSLKCIFISLLPLLWVTLYYVKCGSVFCFKTRYSTTLLQCVVVSKCCYCCCFDSLCHTRLVSSLLLRWSIQLCTTDNRNHQPSPCATAFVMILGYSASSALG